MNGKEMLEAMSFVDERYIEDAEAAPKRRRIHWKVPAAAAACVAVVLVGVLNLSSRKDTAALTAANRMEKIAAHTSDAAEVMPMTAIPEMMVLVVSQEGSTLHCTVAEPGSSGLEVGAEVTVCLPEGCEEPQTGRLLVHFSAIEADGTINALDWIPAD